MRSFANLHHHTTLSYGDGFRTPEEHVAAVVELGYTGVAFTEHGNVSSHVKLERAALGAGIRSGLGVELYCETGDPRRQLKNHLTVIAQNQQGYANLLRLVSDSWLNFKYKPTVTSEMLERYSDGLVVLSGCLGGLLSSVLLGGKHVPEKTRPDVQAAGKVVGWFREVFGDRYFLEVMPHPTLPKQVVLNEQLARLSRRSGVPLVATLDCHYPNADDQDMYPVLHAIDRGGRHNTVEAQSQSWEYDLVLAPQSPDVVFKKLVASGLRRAAAGGAMQTAVDIMASLNVTIPKFKELRYPDTVPSEELFRQWCRRGWEFRGFDRLVGREKRWYVDRMTLEMNLIIKQGFVDYFLVISDLVRWAKNNQIPVGPARGSAAASLVCFALRITEVNPMNFPTLLFERFIDENRHDLPDIDLDFDDEQRWRIRQYLVDQYGAERVGNIGTFTQYKGKNSLDDIQRVYDIPVGVVTAVKEMIIERSSGDLRGSSTIEDSIAMFPKVAAIFRQYPQLRQAMRLEGNTKGMSVHAAGLVVADEPLTNGVAVYSRIDNKTGERGNVLSIDKHDAEYINALKIDALGLTTMGAIRRCLDMVGMKLQQLYDLTFDDPKVFAAFQRNEVVGIFQFDGRAMKSVNREVKPDTFMEICDVNALARPGPLHSGAAAEYIQVKHGRKPAEHHHPIVDKITIHTNYQIVYQEQILQVVRQLGNFTWEQAAQIRKLISKKQGEQAFNRMQELFLAGCAQNGVREVSAARVWKQLVTAGAYAFNAAHCVSYGTIAYWTMWLKVHHPLAFYCSSLQKYDPKTKGFDLLKEAVAKGIAVRPPSPHRSGVTWSVSDGELVAGFTQITGIGDKTASAMVEWRESFFALAENMRRPVTWESYTAVKGIGPATMKKVETFCGDPDPFGVHLLSDRMRVVRGWLAQNADAEQMRAPTSRTADVPYEPTQGQHVVLVAVRERNLKDLYELHRSRTGEELDPGTVKEPQYVNWCVVTGEDETGPLTITVARYGGLYEKYKDALWNMNPKKELLLVEGFKRREYRRAIYVRRLWVINTEEIGS